VRRLLIRPGAIGDVLTSLPALEALANEDTEVWAPRPMLPLLTHLGRVVALADTGIDLLEIGQARPLLLDRLRSFDEIYSWYGSARVEFRTSVAHLPFTFFPALPPPDGSVHAVDFYNAQVGCTGEPRLRFDSVPRSTVAIHPFSGSKKKNWPIDNFRAVAQRVEAEWCVGEDGSYRFDDLGELARWLAGAKAYVGNDSGITHMAAALGVPTTAIFMASDARIWSPCGPHVRVLQRPSPEDVIRSLTETYAAQNES
jgi:ADP-heptose:LPS heptosyltransferase